MVAIVMINGWTYLRRVVVVSIGPSYRYGRDGSDPGSKPCYYLPPPRVEKVRKGNMCYKRHVGGHEEGKSKQLIANYYMICYYHHLVA